MPAVFTKKKNTNQGIWLFLVDFQRAIPFQIVDQIVMIIKNTIQPSAILIFSIFFKLNFNNILFLHFSQFFNSIFNRWMSGENRSRFFFKRTGNKKMSCGSRSIWKWGTGITYFFQSFS